MIPDAPITAIGPLPKSEPTVTHEAVKTLVRNVLQLALGAAIGGWVAPETTKEISENGAIVLVAGAVALGTTVVSVLHKTHLVNLLHLRRWLLVNGEKDDKEAR